MKCPQHQRKQRICTRCDREQSRTIVYAQQIGAEQSAGSKAMQWKLFPSNLLGDHLLLTYEYQWVMSQDLAEMDYHEPKERYRFRYQYSNTVWSSAYPPHDTLSRAIQHSVVLCNLLVNSFFRNKFKIKGNKIYWKGWGLTSSFEYLLRMRMKFNTILSVLSSVLPLKWTKCLYM